ncbi:dna glycosylase [Trichoderma arundinaceum]|uniref:Dna glycosylase n=1 Tax=Trichoderma arundinaceum TaxID=490622 RepID=A0A395NRA7_TRIAR|nr:dna glycosylase [Trichoderma arundinaceum]
MGSVPSQQNIPVWIDCDSGHDDAFAILMAAHHPRIDLLGVSTTYGNSSLENTTYNTLSILDAIGKPDVAVVPGASRPFCRPAANAEAFHGESGLGGTDLLPRPTRMVFGQWVAINEMQKALYSTPKGTAWLIAIGPLTNVALLFATYPDLADHIKGLSIMGGAIGAVDSDNKSEMPCAGTGATSYAEFNIWCDPESARSVFLNPALRPKTVLVPLDLTHQACATADRREKLLHGRHGATRLRTAFYELIMFYGGSYAKDTELKSGPPIHDALAVAAIFFDHEESALNIEVWQTGDKMWAIDVLLAGEQAGRTVIAPFEEGSMVPRTIDFVKFWRMLEEWASQRPRSAAIFDRKRTSSACSVCRARKTKCDSQRPICGFCRDSGGNCRYPEADVSRLDQGSLEVLTRIGRLEESLKLHISQAIDSKLDAISKSEFASGRQPGDGESTTHRPLQLNPEESDASCRCVKTNGAAMCTDVPPSAEVLSHACNMSLEAVLKWPIFLSFLPHLSADLLTTTAEVLAKEGPIATVTEHDVEMAPKMLSAEALDQMVDNFLDNNNIKNPVLDSDTIRRHVQDFNESGPQWDGKTCLILLVCAVSGVSSSLEDERERGVSKSSERLKMAEAFFQASQRRIGMLYHENSILAGQCAFLTGVYLCSTYQIISGWKAFVHASNQCLALLRSNGRLQRKDYHDEDKKDLDAHNGSPGSSYVEESLYWGCLKSEIEIRFELCLPGSGLDRFDYPNVYPSPPVKYHMGTDSSADNCPTTAPFISTSHKDRYSVEIGWLYYLAEIATKRIRSNVWVESYSMPAGHSDWVNQLLKRVGEFDWQIKEWYQALPEKVKFPEDPAIPTGSITKYILRHHMFDIQEDARFPAIQALLGSSSPGLNLRQASPILIRLASELLTVAVNRIQGAREAYFHRHHGQWFGIHCLGRNALQLLGMACKCRQDGGEDGGAQMEQQILPQGWQDAVHLALTFFDYWSDECADARRMGRVVTELLHVYRTLAASRVSPSDQSASAQTPVFSLTHTVE